MIKIQNLTVCYNDLCVFEKANLSLPSKVWLLAGENGSGKTTLLQLLNGNLDKFKKDKMVSQNSEIYISDKVILLDENTEIPLMMREKELYSLIMKINNMPIDNKYEVLSLDKKLIQYSLGQRKLAILKMVAQLSPQILLLDEYLTNLDENNTAIVLKLLNTMKESGSTIIISSNDEYLKEKINCKIKIEDKGLHIIDDEQ